MHPSEELAVVQRARCRGPSTASRQPASHPASQPEFCMHDHAQIRKIQSIFVHAVHARGLPAWLAAEMVRSADFDPRARRQPAACAQN